MEFDDKPTQDYRREESKTTNASSIKFLNETFKSKLEMNEDDFIKIDSMKNDSSSRPKSAYQNKSSILMSLRLEPSSRKTQGNKQ